MKKRPIAAVGLAIAGLMLAGCSTSASPDGDSYPDKKITFIVQAAAGGSSDLSARAVAPKLAEILGQDVIVENRPGASGSIAVQYMADQPADGYTIGYAPVEFAMFEHLGFDIDRSDYDFLAGIHNAPSVLVVPGSSEIDNLDDYFEAAEKKQLSVGTAGAGTMVDAAANAFATQSDANLQTVPFDGGAPTIAALLGGQVDSGVALTSETFQHHNDGTLKVIAVFGDERHPLLPDVPTAKEQDFDLVFEAWSGIYAPAGLEEPVRARLESAIEEAVTSDEVLEFFEKNALVPKYGTGEEFATHLEEEAARYGDLL